MEDSGFASEPSQFASFKAMQTKHKSRGRKPPNSPPDGKVYFHFRFSRETVEALRQRIPRGQRTKFIENVIQKCLAELKESPAR